MGTAVANWMTISKYASCLSWCVEEMLSGERAAVGFCQSRTVTSSFVSRLCMSPDSVYGYVYYVVRTTLFCPCVAAHYDGRFAWEKW